MLTSLHLTGSLSRDGGGLFTALQGLLPALAAQGDAVSLHGLVDASWSVDAASWLPLTVHAHAVVGPAVLGYSPAMRRAVHAAPADVIHCHGLWRHYSVVARNLQRARRLPLVVSPHGMLNATALQVGHFKKQVALWLHERALLMGAQCLHALVPSELESIRQFGYRGPVCVVPNGVDLPDQAQVADTTVPGWMQGDSPLPANARVLLSIGRKHPIKNLDGLLQAWRLLEAQQAAPDWFLVVAGWGEPADEAALSQLFASLNLQRARLLGPMFGPEKAAALRAAQGFALVSHGEALPVAMLEAWAYGLPAVLTRECRFPQAYASGAALPADTAPAALAEALMQFMQLSPQARQTMGQAGRALVERDFTWQGVAMQLHAVYRWLLDGGTPPACVEPALPVGATR